jgi:hypothetical protein
MKDLKVQAVDLLQKDAVSAKRDEMGRLIDKYVLSQPRGPERWRAAVKLWLALGDMYITPGFESAEQENQAVIRDNRMKREALKNEYGKSDDSNSDLREALNMPFGANLFIKIVDPQFFTLDNVPKIRKEFPEYAVSAKF